MLLFVGMAMACVCAQLLFVILIKGKSFILKRLADTPANSTKRTLVRSIPNALIVR